MICKHILPVIILNERELIFCTQLNGSKYCYVSRTIQLNISHLFTRLNNQTVLFEKNQFSISHLFALSLNIKLFYFKCQTILFDRQVGPYQELIQVRVDLGAMAIKVYSTFPKSPRLEPHYLII